MTFCVEMRARFLGLFEGWTHEHYIFRILRRPITIRLYVEIVAIDGAFFAWRCCQILCLQRVQKTLTICVAVLLIKFSDPCNIKTVHPIIIPFYFSSSGKSCFNAHSVRNESLRQRWEVLVKLTPVVIQWMWVVAFLQLWFN